MPIARLQMNILIILTFQREVRLGEEEGSNNEEKMNLLGTGTEASLQYDRIYLSNPGSFQRIVFPSDILEEQKSPLTVTRKYSSALRLQRRLCNFSGLTFLSNRSSVVIILHSTSTERDKGEKHLPS